MRSGFGRARRWLASATGRQRSGTDGLRGPGESRFDEKQYGDIFIVPFLRRFPVLWQKAVHCASCGVGVADATGEELMRYYFRDNRPGPMARLFLGGAALLALMSAIGGLYYSEGLSFAVNPLAGAFDAAKDGARDRGENLEPIFIPIRKKFPPDPFAASGEQAGAKASATNSSPAEVPTRKIRTIQAAPEPVAPPVSVGVEQNAVSSAQPSSSVAEKADQSAAQAKAAEQANSSDSRLNLAPDSVLDLPSTVAATPAKKSRQTAARPLASVKRESQSPGSEPVQPKKIGRTTPSQPVPPRAGVKQVKSAKPSKIAKTRPQKPRTRHAGKREVAIIKSKPGSSVSRTAAPAEVAVRASSVNSQPVSRPLSPKYKKLDTVVEISDSGDTVAGKRWKDVSSTSD